MQERLKALLKALLGYHPQRIIPDALAPSAVPFESYTQEQGERAVTAVQALVSLVTQKFPPAADE